MYPYRTLVDTTLVDIYLPEQTEFNIKSHERLNLAESEVWRLYSQIDSLNILVTNYRELTTKLNEDKRLKDYNYQNYISKLAEKNRRLQNKLNNTKTDLDRTKLWSNFLAILASILSASIIKHI